MLDIKTFEDLNAFIKDLMKRKFHGDIKLVFDYGTIIRLHKSTNAIKCNGTGITLKANGSNTNGRTNGSSTNNHKTNKS